MLSLVQIEDLFAFERLGADVTHVGKGILVDATDVRGQHVLCDEAERKNSVKRKFNII